MEYRLLGAAGLKVPVLSFGTATFGGEGEFFAAWGRTQVEEARRLIDICLDAGINFFDTANVYSRGRSEEVLGGAVAGRRDQVLLSTKGTFAMGDGPNDGGASRHALIRACEASLRRLGTDYIDVYYMHGFDALTPVAETLSALDDLIRAGKVRYIGCSNFSGWHLMKSLSVSERHGWARYVAHQAYYSLASREFEWELMPLALDQNVGTVVWSALAGGALTGKMRRGQPMPTDSRLATADFLAGARSDKLYDTIDAIAAIAAETGKTPSQVALNWVLQRPTVTSIVVGARNEAQLRQNLGAVGWALSPAQMARLDAASATRPIYPYWHSAPSRRAIPRPSREKACRLDLGADTKRIQPRRTARISVDRLWIVTGQGYILALDHNKEQGRRKADRKIAARTIGGRGESGDTRCAYPESVISGSWRNRSRV